MGIRRLKIENFKRFRNLEVTLNEGTNIIVGQNDAGKSTILEAIHLAVTGLLGGRYLRNELSQHLFNNDAVTDYLKALKTPPAQDLPAILIEVYLADGEFPLFEGDGNSGKIHATGFFLKVHFDPIYQSEYHGLVAGKGVSTLPIEYYTITCQSFARQPLTPRSQPLRSALIDSSAARYQNGSDVYISRIVRDFLDTQDTVAMAQAYRHMKEGFRNDPSIALVNVKLQTAAQMSAKSVTLSAELPAKSEWEDSLVTCVAEVPFQYIGKGEQSLVKTKLALHHKKAKDAAVILLEEPENHLTHGNLNSLLNYVGSANPEKQIIVSTHSSFVANKLGLNHLILLNSGGISPLAALDKATMEFFQKIAGYDTLRLLLAKKAILVEGDSDELLVQKAYLNKHCKLPLIDGIDVISVGTSFLRFLAVADLVNQQVVVVTDNDGDVYAVQKKYKEYLSPAQKPHVRICFDPTVDTGTDPAFNYNTLEPKLLKANGLKAMNGIFGSQIKTAEEMHRHMRAHKTDCALKVFSTTLAVQFPQYILDAIS